MVIISPHPLAFFYNSYSSVGCIICRYLKFVNWMGALSMSVVMTFIDRSLCWYRLIIHEGAIWLNYDSAGYCHSSVKLGRVLVIIQGYNLKWATRSLVNRQLWVHIFTWVISMRPPIHFLICARSLSLVYHSAFCHLIPFLTGLSEGIYYEWLLINSYRFRTLV